MYIKKEHAGFIFMLSIILFTFVLAGCQGEQENADSHLKKGTDYFAEQDYPKARIEFLNATQLAPDNAEAWHQLGETMIHLGNAREAFQAYSKAEALAPDNPDILLKTASFLMLSDQMALAEKKIDKILAESPQNTKALFLKARLLAQKGNLSQAEALFKQILSLEPNHISALEKMAAIKTFQKDEKAAEQLLLRAINADKKNLNTRMTLVSFYIRQKAFKKAEAQLITAGHENPDVVDLPIFLGNFYMGLKNTTAAENAYTHALEMSKNTVKPHVAAARFYEATGNKDKALSLYSQALALEPDNLMLKSTLAQFHLNNGKISEATSLVNSILEVRPGFFPALMLDAELKIFNKNYEMAQSRLQSLEKERPDNARLHYLKGICHMNMNNISKAVTSLARSLDLDPGETGAAALLARLYYNTGEFDPARQQALNVLEKDPANFLATDILANCDMEAGHRDQAIEGFQKLINLAPENPRGYQLMGLLYAYEQNYDESKAYLTQALDRSDFALDIIALLVRNHMAQKKYNAAHELIRQQLNNAGDSPRFLATLHKLDGDVYLAEQDKASALTAFQKAMNIDADFQPPYYALARIYMETGNIDEAIGQYTRLLEKHPDLVTAHMMLGVLMDAKGLYEQGATHYKKALATRPRYAPAANNLAWHLIQRTDKVNEALSWARVAKEVLPEDPAIMDTLGLVYLKKGLMDSAITEFKDSLKKSPDNPEVMLHLGQAYHTKGDTLNAGVLLKKLLTMDDNQNLKQQAANLLETMKE